jgi:YnbE-like lipoprotein
MMQLILTPERQGARRRDMKKILSLALAFSVVACGGCVRVQAPDKPIEINLNVTIRQEVVVTLRKDAADLINANQDLFPK